MCNGQRKKRDETEQNWNNSVREKNKDDDDVDNHQFRQLSLLGFI